MRVAKSTNKAVRFHDRVVLTSRHFLNPAEAIHAVVMSPEEKAIKAWSIFEQTIARIGSGATVFFEDPRISAMIEYFGGWESTGMWLEEDMVYYRNEFVRRYVAILNPPPPKRHPGKFERQNGAFGYHVVSTWKIVAADGKVAEMKRLPLSKEGFIDIPLGLPEPGTKLASPKGKSESARVVLSMQGDLSTVCCHPPRRGTRFLCPRGPETSLGAIPAGSWEKRGRNEIRLFKAAFLWEPMSPHGEFFLRLHFIQEKKVGEISLHPGCHTFG